MGLLIIFRKQAAVNRFRDIIIGAINQGMGTRALICSGFFQELFKNSQYRASQEMNFSNILAQKSIELTTVGIHNRSWLPSYKEFRNSLRAAGVNIHAKYAPRFQWHAKIFILHKGNNPILAIIGSSNLTRNAFSVSSPYNNEADVIMWDDNEVDLTKFILETIANADADPNDFIIADYDPEKNSNLAMDERIKRLDSEMKQISLTDLPD